MQHRTRTGANETIARPGRRARSTAVAVGMGVGLAVLSAAALPDPRAGQEVDDVRATLEKLIETRALISKEHNDWRVGREALEERIDVVRTEIENRRAATAESRESVGEVDGNLKELEEERDRLVQASSSLREVIAGLETRTLALLEDLPDPAVERIQVLRQRVPKDPETTEESLGQRFLNVVGILNELNRFQSEVNAYSEVRTLGDGSNAEVTALYLGLGKGYYVTATDDAAGTSLVTDEGWTWMPLDAASIPEVRRAVAIHAAEEAADFVHLPIEVR